MRKTTEVFYTSDLHIGHKFVAGLRGFEHDHPQTGEFGLSVKVPDTDAHDAWLAKNWDSRVQSQDIVYVLGDISINGGQHALDWIEQRPGTKHLVAGNHDPVHPQDRRATKRLPHWHKYFETIQPFLRLKLAGETVLLSHFPYASFGDGVDRPGSRYNQYRLPDMGERLLHGHTHGFERAHGKMYHVGVDAWAGRLVPQAVILDWIQGP